MRGRLWGAVGGTLAFWTLACGMLGDGAAALQKQEAFADRTCACADAACLTRVQKEKARWMADHPEDLAAAAVEDSERLQAAVDRSAACIERIGGAQVEGVTGAGSPKPGSGRGNSRSGARRGKTGKTGGKKGGKGKQKRR